MKRQKQIPQVREIVLAALDRRVYIGMPISELAHRAGLSPQYISGIENGHHCPTLDVFARLVEPLCYRLALVDVPQKPEDKEEVRDDA